MQRALGEPAVADLAALRRADAAGLAGRVRRHVVVEHEALAVLAHQRVDDLLVARGAERGDDQRLRLAAREQRRAVRARQHAGADGDRAHGARVAAVDARLAGEDLVADDLRFEVEQRCCSTWLRVSGVGVGRDALGVDLGRRSRSAAAGAPASSGCDTPRAGRSRRRPRPASISASSFAGGCQSHSGLPRFLDELVDRARSPPASAGGRTPRRRASRPRAARALPTRPSARRLRCRRRRGSSCDVASSVLVGLSTYCAVDVADARGADRAVERNAGERDRRRRADHRRNVGIDLGIDRHHRRDDLHFVVEAVRETAAGSAGR